VGRERKVHLRTPGIAGQPACGYRWKRGGSYTITTGGAAVVTCARCLRLMAATQETPHMTTHAYGWVRDKLDHRDRLLGEALIARPLPSRIDLRETGRLGFPIYDQGQLGACTANAIAAGVRFAELAQAEGRPVAPSRLFIYLEERRLEGNLGTDSGAEIRDGLKVVAKGYPDESLWPYDIARFAVIPPPDIYRAARKDRVTRYYRVPTDATAMKTALLLGFPVVVGFSVFPGMESDAAAHTGVVPMPGRDEAPLGGHAVLLVGYDDRGDGQPGRWICRNSWGEDWGDGGYFYVPYGYLDSPDYAGDFWTIRREVEG
jgi:C1A family cysteine protease